VCTKYARENLMNPRINHPDGKVIFRLTFSFSMKPFKFRVVNVVASGNLGMRLDLDAIARAFPNAKHAPGTFPGLVFRLEKPKTATLLFENGKLVCTGAKSESEAINAAYRVSQLLKNAGFKVESPKLKVVNMVATADLGCWIGLADLYEKARAPASRLIYEPDQFPAAICRTENPHITLLIFPNGKVVCIGARKTEEAAEAIKKLKKWLKETEAI